MSVETSRTRYVSESVGLFIPISLKISAMSSSY